MLTTLRSGLNSFFVIFLLGLLIASFAIWGIGDIFTAQSTVVAKVGKTEITANDYIQAFQNRVQTYQAQFGPTFTTQQAIALGVHRQVLASLVQRATLDEEADQLGLIGSNDSVIAQIQEMDVFKDPLGEFSRFNYDARLAQAGLTPAAFEESLRLDLARGQLIDSIFAAKPVPLSLIDTLYTFRKETRRASILRLTTAIAGEVPTPSDEALNEYYTDNPAKYMTPEYRSLTIMQLDPEHFADEMEFTEDELNEAFSFTYDKFQTPETRSVDVLVLDNQQAAQDVYDRIQAGEDLTDIAAEVSGFSPEDLALGELDYYTIETDYNDVAAERVFALNEGAVTEPTQTLFGWHIFRVSSITPGVERTIDDVREELIADLKAERGLDAVYSLVERIEDELAAGADMQTLVERTGVSVTHFDKIDANGLTEAGTVAPNAAETADIIAIGFRKHMDDELELTEAESGGYYLVQINEVIEPEVKDFDAVREDVVRDYTADELIRRAGEIAELALTQAQAGKSLQDLAREYGSQVVTTNLIERDQARSGREVAPAIANLIFSLDVNEIDMERAATGDGYILVQTTEINAGQPDREAVDYMVLTDRIRSELEGDLLTQYQLAVQNSLGVEIDYELIEQMMTPDGIILPGTQQVGLQ